VGGGVLLVDAGGAGIRGMRLGISCRGGGRRLQSGVLWGLFCWREDVEPVSRI